MSKFSQLEELYKARDNLDPNAYLEAYTTVIHSKKEWSGCCGGKYEEKYEYDEYRVNWDKYTKDKEIINSSINNLISEVKSELSTKVNELSNKSSTLNTIQGQVNIKQTKFNHIDNLRNSENHKFLRLKNELDTQEYKNSKFREEKNLIDSALNQKFSSMLPHELRRIEYTYELSDNEHLKELSSRAKEIAEHRELFINTEERNKHLEQEFEKRFFSEEQDLVNLKEFLGEHTTNN